MKIASSILFLVIVGCNGMNSELRSPFFSNDKDLQIPRCQFEVADNCWQRSLDLMMACVPKINPDIPTYFSEERLRCSNQTLGGKTEIVFRDPINLDNPVKLEGLSFRVYNDFRPCFNFTGHRRGFTVDANLFGTLEVLALENGDTHITCFGGESLTISKEIEDQGCYDGETTIAGLVPRVLLNQPDEEQSSLSITLAGLGQKDHPVFSCTDL